MCHSSVVSTAKHDTHMLGWSGLARWRVCHQPFWVENEGFSARHDSSGFVRLVCEAFMNSNVTVLEALHDACVCLFSQLFQKLHRACVLFCIKAIHTVRCLPFPALSLLSLQEPISSYLVSHICYIWFNKWRVVFFFFFLSCSVIFLHLWPT